MTDLRRHSISLASRCAALLAALLLTLGWAAGQPAGEQPAAAPAPPRSVPASRQAQRVAIITIEGPITSFTTLSVRRRLNEAVRAGADAVVFELNTPGGEVGAALELCTLIKQSPIGNTVAWVNPQAYSAGTLIALACREIVASSAASMGDALPIKLGILGNLETLGEAERQKILSPLLAEVVDSARRRGYDEYLVQAFVALGVELWLVEDKETQRRFCVDRREFVLLFGHPPEDDRPAISSAPPIERSSPTLADQPQPTASELIPPTAPELVGPVARDEDAGIILDSHLGTTRPALTAADAGRYTLIERVTDGRGPLVLTGDQIARYGFSASTIAHDGELKDFFGAREIARLEPQWSETTAEFLANPIARGVLIVIFLVAIFLEMVITGAFVPGIVAGVALTLLLAPPIVAQMASWWAVGAVLLGLVLIALELFVIPGFGIAGVAGLILFFGGLIGTFAPVGSGGIFPNSPAGRESFFTGLVTLLISGVTAGVGITLIARRVGSLPAVRSLVLRGAVLGPEAAAEPAATPEGPLRIGQIGTAETPLRPAGRAMFDGRLYDVVADLGYIAAGTRVRVTTIDLRIVVEALGETSVEKTHA